MAIDDNTSYELTGAQVKDLAQRIQSGGGGSNAVILYSRVSFHTPIQLVDIYSDAALTTSVTGPTVKDYIEAGKTVAIIYETSVSDVPQNETLIITSCDNHSEATHGVIVFTGTFFDYTNSEPVLYTLACDQPSNLWSASQKSIPTKTSELTNDGDDGVHAFLATDDVATVATTGAYSDLSGTPSLATVATSGSYTDLSDKPTIPTVNNATLTIQKNSSTVKTFTANASSDVTANITVPTGFSDLSGTVSTNQIAANAVTTGKLATSTWVNGSYKSGYKASTNTSYKQNIQATIVGRMLYIRFGVSPSSGSFAKDTEYTFGSIPATVNGTTVSGLCTSAKQNIPRFLCSGQYGMYGWCQLIGTDLTLSFSAAMGNSCGWMCGQLMIPIDY